MVKFKPEAASFLDAAVTSLYWRCDDPFGNFGYGCNSAANRYFMNWNVLFRWTVVRKNVLAKAGLNLWYVIHFDEDTNLEQVAKDLSQVADVAKVQFTILSNVHTILMCGQQFSPNKQ